MLIGWYNQHENQLLSSRYQDKSRNPLYQRESLAKMSGNFNRSRQPKLYLQNQTSRNLQNIKRVENVALGPTKTTPQRMTSTQHIVFVPNARDIVINSGLLGFSLHQQHKQEPEKVAQSVGEGTVAKGMGKCHINKGAGKGKIIKTKKTMPPPNRKILPPPAVNTDTKPRVPIRAKPQPRSQPSQKIGSAKLMNVVMNKQTNKGGGKKPRLPIAKLKASLART